MLGYTLTKLFDHSPLAYFPVVSRFAPGLLNVIERVLNSNFANNEANNPEKYIFIQKKEALKIKDSISNGKLMVEVDKSTQ